MSEYLLSKKKFEIDVPYTDIPRMKEIVASFGHGTYSHHRDSYQAQRNRCEAFEIWLTTEELAILKLTVKIPWCMELRV